ncbi:MULTISPECIES: hypothetical protein [Streptosporangium]|uniref:DUF1918 domain-containing protein n=1 Tax=Streptosporangium brasiliense TaxID=47480 RepID=A0ABT9RLF6_9ACTN|nr:hypothetical protein [Streptosporangium brasiliense]MDP9869677.1 hypothetical protein [Streptosporangium brasiliense]
MTTSPDDLPVLQVRGGITCTDDERPLVDGGPVPPGRYRLQLGDEDGEMPVLTVAGDDEGLVVISAAELS